MCEDAPCCGCCGWNELRAELAVELEDGDFGNFGHDEYDDGQPSDLTEHEDFERADEFYGVFEDMGDFGHDEY